MMKKSNNGSQARVVRGAGSVSQHDGVRKAGGRPLLLRSDIGGGQHVKRPSLMTPSWVGWIEKKMAQGGESPRKERNALLATHY
jgi:hypothetical protein